MGQHKDVEFGRSNGQIRGTVKTGFVQSPDASWATYVKHET